MVVVCSFVHTSDRGADVARCIVANSLALAESRSIQALFDWACVIFHLCKGRRPA